MKTKLSCPLQKSNISVNWILDSQCHRFQNTTIHSSMKDPRTVCPLLTRSCTQAFSNYVITVLQNWIVDLARLNWSNWSEQSERTSRKETRGAWPFRTVGEGLLNRLRRSAKGYWTASGGRQRVKRRVTGIHPWRKKDLFSSWTFRAGICSDAYDTW